MARDTRELAGAWARFQHHAFPSPAPDLAPYVERYWVVTWDYAEPYRQLIVPYPSVHLTFHDGAARLQGAGHRAPGQGAGGPRPGVRGGVPAGGVPAVPGRAGLDDHRPASSP